MILTPQRLRDSGLFLFDRRTVANVLGVRLESATPILHRLTKRGILQKLRRDRYVLRDAIPGNLRRIANFVVRPSYISLWTALSDAGFTTQSPQTIQSVTTGRQQTVDLAQIAATFEYRRLPERLYFGWIIDDEGVYRAQPEKALLDLIYLQKSGIDWQSLDINEFDVQRISRFMYLFPKRVQRSVKSLLTVP